MQDDDPTTTTNPRWWTDATLKIIFQLRSAPYWLIKQNLESRSRITFSSQNAESWKSRYFRKYETNHCENLTQC